MKCPACGSESSSVIDSRVRHGNIMRRRRCDDCGGRWSTEERTLGHNTARTRKLAGLRRSIRALDRTVGELGEL